MRQRSVPVTLGSPRFRTVEAGALRVTDAWFPPDVCLPPHHHERPCFAVVVDGSFDVRFSRKTHDCQVATIWTEPPGERHANRAEHAGARVVVVQPDLEQDDLMQPLMPLLDGIHHFRDAAIATFARRCAVELRQQDAVATLALQGLAFEMLSSAVRGRFKPKREPTLPPWLARVQESIHASFREPLELSALAHEAGVHPVHLSRVFRGQFGTTLGDYVRTLRLDWAAERLVTSESPLADVALDSGYADQSHFTRAFKAHTGTTPARYRAAKRPPARHRS